MKIKFKTCKQHESRITEFEENENETSSLGKWKVSGKWRQNESSFWGKKKVYLHFERRLWKMVQPFGSLMVTMN